MIVMGFPGIGKSTMAGKESGYVDLDSSLFSRLGDQWFKAYADVAYALDGQGFNVFLSTHMEVVDFIGTLKSKYRSPVKVVVCAPCMGLEKFWIKRLEDRWWSAPTEENRRAWKSVEGRWSDVLLDLDMACRRYGFRRLEIEGEGYDLGLMLKPLDGRKAVCKKAQVVNGPCHGL